MNIKEAIDLLEEIEEEIEKFNCSDGEYFSLSRKLNRIKALIQKQS